MSYEVTFIEANNTVEVEDYDALIEMIGEDDAELALSGNLPHIVVVDLNDDYYDDDGQPDELTEWMDFDPDC